jgi:hypothetical protein
MPGGAPYQIGIAVADLELAVKTYISVTHDGPFSVWTYDTTELVSGSTFRGEQAPYAARVAISAGSPQIEYLEPLAGGVSIVHQHVEDHGYGLHHLGFRADDLELAIETMTAAGFPPVQTVSGWGLDGDGRAVFFDTFDLLGYWVEVVSPAARRRPAQAMLSGR